MQQTNTNSYATEGRFLKLSALTACALLATTIVVAFMTRPIPTDLLPSNPHTLTPSLKTTHNNPSTPCLRWATPPPLDRTTAHTILRDFETNTPFVADLHILLPTLSLLRTSNNTTIDQHHTHTARHELHTAITRNLPLLDRLRLAVHGDRLDEILHNTQKLQPDPQQRTLDELRSKRLQSQTTPAQLDAIRTFVQRHQHTLSTRSNQLALVHIAAQRSTNLRISALSTLLQAYRTRHKRYPNDLPTLLQSPLLHTTPNLDPLHITRGLENDGTLRDGWLRPFSYYTLGPQSFRLTSQGPSDSSQDDNIILQSIQGQTPFRNYTEDY